MKRTVGSASTSAILIANAVPFTVRQGDFKGGTKPTLTVEGLAGTETVTICRSGGSGDPQPLRNGVIDRSSEGSIQLEFAGELLYFKDATAGSIVLKIENSI